MDHALLLRGVGVTAAALLPLTGVIAAGAASPSGSGDEHAVFVQTNNPSGNRIAVYQRGEDGTLSLAATVATGGDGARAAGSASDPLASQGSLILDSQRSLLLGVNAGSDSISVFHVDGLQLDRADVAWSHGEFPTSLAVHDDKVFVLNAGGAANVSGFRVDGDHLHPIPGDTRSLGLSETNPPNFLAAPAQVGFSPDGRELIVTGKTNNFIDVFRVAPDGELSAAPVQTSDANVPFAFLFGPRDQLDLVNAAGNLAPERIRHDGAVVAAGSAVPNGQTAACWIARSDDLAFVANTGSNDVSAYRITDQGAVSLIDATAATNIAGAIDEAVSDGVLYVQSGLASSVEAFRIGSGGSLTWVETVTVPGGGSQEGIATS